MPKVQLSRGTFWGARRDVLQLPGEPVQLSGSRSVQAAAHPGDMITPGLVLNMLLAAAHISVCRSSWLCLQLGWML